MIFAVALAVRLLWTTKVESPFDNLFSDMGGYISRARVLAYGEPNTVPEFDTFFPPGVHLLYAAEMKLAGFDHHVRMLLVNCLWGAVVGPCAALLAMRIVARRWVAALIGMFVALWYPLLAFSGFFSSEQPYAGAIALSTWLLVRQIEGGKNAVMLGVFSALAYLERPQIILTLAALGVLALPLLARDWLGRKIPALPIPAAPRLQFVRLVIAGCILTAAVGFGAWRYHKLSGRWQLISDNGAMARLGADTDYGNVRSTNGYFFGSPPKNEVGENRELLVTGYVGDPGPIERARRDAVRKMTFGARVTRWVMNVRFLFVDNSLWPEVTHIGTGWRRSLYVGSQNVLMGALVPFAALGLLVTFRRPTTVQVVCAAHVLTMLVTAAFFCGEARYRVPYDMFIVLLAVVGLRSCASVLQAPEAATGKTVPLDSK